MQEIIMESISG